jgi:hypothetical protein
VRQFFSGLRESEKENAMLRRQIFEEIIRPQVVPVIRREGILRREKKYVENSFRCRL